MQGGLILPNADHSAASTAAGGRARWAGRRCGLRARLQPANVRFGIPVYAALQRVAVEDETEPVLIVSPLVVELGRHAGKTSVQPDNGDLLVNGKRV